MNDHFWPLGDLGEQSVRRGARQPQREAGPVRQDRDHYLYVVQGLRKRGKIDDVIIAVSIRITIRMPNQIGS